MLQKGPERNTGYTTTVHRGMKLLFQGVVTSSRGQQGAGHPEKKLEATQTPRAQHEGSTRPARAGLVSPGGAENTRTLARTRNKRATSFIVYYPVGMNRPSRTLHHTQGRKHLQEGCAPPK